MWLVDSHFALLTQTKPRARPILISVVKVSLEMVDTEDVFSWSDIGGIRCYCYYWLWKLPSPKIKKKVGLGN